MYDVVVIGAGLGGLTAAVKLAQSKKKVLVLERHFIPGGCATGFQRKGIKMEVGLHEMDWGKKHNFVRKALIEMKMMDKIPFVEIPEAWSVKTEKETITVPHGNAQEYFEKNFPEDKKGIRAYFRYLRMISWINRGTPHNLSFWDFFFFPITTAPIMLMTYLKQETVASFMDKHIKSDKLKNILNINIVYYHTNPKELTMFYHSSAQAGYYGGARFVKGGSQALSDALVAEINQHGGEVRLLADAQKIMLKDGKACGVEWKNIKDKSVERVECKHVIAACAPKLVYEQMLPAEYEDKNLRFLENSSSLYTIYLIFKKRFADVFPGNAYSTFITSDKNINEPLCNLEYNVSSDKFDKLGFAFVDYNKIDSGLVPEGDDRGTGVLCGGSFLSQWENLSIEAYKAKKEELAQALFTRMEERFPGFRDLVEYYEVSTPKTIQRYLNTPEGTAYGYKQNAYGKGGRAKFRSPTVKNLHFAGAWTFPGGGFSAVILGGYWTARDLMCSTKITILWRTIASSIVGTAIGISISSLLHML